MTMFRPLIIIAIILVTFHLYSQEETRFDAHFNGYVSHGIITAEHTLLNFSGPLKSGAEKPFSIEVSYEGSDCNSNLSSIEVYNSKFPLFWYEITENGERRDPLINPDPSRLKDHTTYLVEDFYLHSDTVYVDFTKAFEFHGLHPNPVADRAVLRYTAFNTLPVSFDVYNILGEILYSGSAMFEASASELSIDLGNFKPGTYFLHIRCACMEEIIKFVNSGL